MLACCLAIALAALTGAASAAKDARGGKPNATSDSPALLEDSAQINIGADLSLPEGDSGQTAFQFPVTLDRAQSAPVTVDFSTPSTIGSATPGSDYTATSGTLTFAPSETSKTITVQVNGDTTVEPDETFFVNLANPSANATLGDLQAAATILNDDQQPAQINIGADLSLPEGDSGQTAFQFPVTLDRAQSAPVTVDFSTPSTIGSATPGSDYTATSGTLTFAPGETSKTITVQVNGDTTVEPDETFFVNLANPSANATLGDLQAAATILNDDQVVIEPPAQISIADLSLPEGDIGQTAFGLTISLDRAESTPVTVDYSTADGTATAPSDYIAGSGTLIFAPGETTKTITVQVNGDTSKEASETFSVNLANVTGNATIADGHAGSTIVNDDRHRHKGKHAERHMH
jgi:chitinase